MLDLTAQVIGSASPGPFLPSPPRGGLGGGGRGGQSSEQLTAGFLARSEAFQARQDDSATFLRSLAAGRTMARRELAARAWKRDTGLSNPAYLAATSGTQFLRVQVESARVKFTISDPVAETLTPLRGLGGIRGDISELSEASRSRLANRAWALSAEGHEPQIMVTLTSPANWEQIYVADSDGVVIPGGRLLKQHMEAFRKRLGRKLSALGIASWSALWFLEFQQRGAPHVHLMLFGCAISAGVRKALRAWCGPAWSSVVGNPDRVERDKHKRIGTQVARMKAKHFGYAVKYATKTEQKDVPDDFRQVGRFWGCWNYRSPEPVVLDLDYSRLNPQEAAWVTYLVQKVMAGIVDHSPAFYGAKLGQFNRAINSGIKQKQGFTVFGKDASQTALEYLNPNK